MSEVKMDGRPAIVSKKESRLCRWLDSQGVEYRQSVRDVVDGFELDVYIPARQVAVEVNSAYYHSTCHKDVEYHLRKSSAAASRGVTLYHVWDETPVFWIRYFLHTLSVRPHSGRGLHPVYFHPFADQYYQYYALHPSSRGDGYVCFVDDHDHIVCMVCYELSSNGLDLVLTAVVTDPRFYLAGLDKLIVGEMTRMARDRGCHCISFRCCRDSFPYPNSHFLSRTMSLSGGGSLLEPYYYKFQEGVAITEMPVSGEEAGLPTLCPRLGRTIAKSEFQGKGWLQVVTSGYWEYFLFV